MARIYAALQPGVNRTLPEDYQSHYLHCIDYLRQAIMCAGDVAMEPHSPTDADDNGPGDGSWAGYHGEIYHRVPGCALVDVLAVGC